MALTLLLAGPAYASVSLTPSSWNFGTLAVGGTSAPKSFTLTVTCVPSPDGTIPCQYAQYFSPLITTTGDYAVTSEDCPDMMVGGPAGSPISQSCTISATFGPTAAGTRSGTLQTGGPSASLTGFAPALDAPTNPAGIPPATSRKKCKKHRAASAAKKKCKKKGRAR